MIGFGSQLVETRGCRSYEWLLAHHPLNFRRIPLNEAEIRAIVQRVVEQSMGGSKPAAKAEPDPKVPQTGRLVAIGADHGGFSMKEALKKDLTELGYEMADVGTYSQDAVDYPDFALAVAQMVSSGQAWRGVVIDGAGIGSCMVANKVPGVRAAMAYDHASASNSREHNDANVLTLGAGLIGPNLAKQILKTWLTTEFGGGRHAKRVDKIIEIEKQFLK
jgi:ribose 5-phosphate isomerase B